MREWTVEQLEALTYAALGDPECETFWGSHGCARPAGHELPHVCGTPDPDDGLCSIHDGEGVRFILGGNAAGEQAAIGEEITQDIVDSRSYDMPLFS